MVIKKTSREIQAGQLKAQCLQLMDKVKAKLVPIKEKPMDLFGCLKSTISIQEEIIEPIDVNWESPIKA